MTTGVNKAIPLTVAVSRLAMSSLLFGPGTSVTKFIAVMIVCPF